MSLVKDFPWPSTWAQPTCISRHYYHMRSRGSSALVNFTALHSSLQHKSYITFLPHPLNLVTKSNFLRYLLSKEASSGWVARWLLQLREFDKTIVTPKGIRSQALADLLPQFPSSEHEPFTWRHALWRDMFYGGQRMAPCFRWLIHSSSQGGKGEGVVLYDPEGADVALSFRLEFLCSNNVVEYKTLVIKLISALQMRIRKLQVQRDSNLLIQQINEEFVLKESALAFYRVAVQKLIKLFSSIQFGHVPRSHNKHTDSLKILA